MDVTDPLAFMSYVRSDDEHDGGHLTEFRDRLSSEVQMQTGIPFPIFQDRNDIQWGQNWKERIEDSLNGVTFLIPVITPSFFLSPACRDELSQFLERESQLGRNDLILPFYYVDCPLLNDKQKRENDELAQAISEHNYADWRELRFEPFTTPQAGKMLAQLAVQIRDALDRLSEADAASVAPSKPSRRRRGKRPVQSGEPTTDEDHTEVSVVGESAAHKPAEGPPQRTEPPTHTVDPMHHGDFTTIMAAIDKAEPGDRILIYPGLYEEGLIIDKPLEIIGQGAVEDIVIQVSGKDTVMFQTTMGRISNVTLRQLGDGNWFGVDIGQGRLELEDCDISSQSLACVGIHGGADPRLRRNRIHDGKQSGVHVYDNAQGTLEDNDIFGNMKAGMSIREGSNPTLRRNRINHNGYEAIWVSDGGAGTFEDNDLRDNVHGAWDIDEDSVAKVVQERNLE